MRSVALSFACNNACVFCAQGGLRDAASTDPAEAIARTIAELAPGETVALMGGEPTLDDRLPEWIRALDAAGAGKIVVQTNARRLAYRSFASALRAASGRVALDVSIAGSTEAMHDYHTGTPGSFKQTLLGLRSARAERIPAALSCVVTRSNFRHLAEIVRLAHACGAVAVRFVIAQPLGRALAVRDRVVPAPELVAPYLGLAQAEAAKLRLPLRASTTGAAEETAIAAFAGLGVVETQADRDAQTPRSESEKDARRSLAVLGRPAPGRREERTPSRRTGDDLRAIFPALFEGAPPRSVEDVVRAAASADEERAAERGAG